MAPFLVGFFWSLIFEAPCFCCFNFLVAHCFTDATFPCRNFSLFCSTLFLFLTFPVAPRFLLIFTTFLYGSLFFPFYNFLLKHILLLCLFLATPRFTLQLSIPAPFFTVTTLSCSTLFYCNFLMKNSIMLYIIWVFTVCKITCLGISGIQRVKPTESVFLSILMRIMTTQLAG